MNRLKSFTGEKVVSRFCKIIEDTKNSFSQPPVIDWKQIVSRSNEYKEEAIARNEKQYCSIIDKLLALSVSYNNSSNNFSIGEELNRLASLLPNTVHPDVKLYDGDFKVVKIVGEKKCYPFKPLNCAELLMEKDLMKMSNINLLCGERSYYLVLELAKLEQALIDYTVQKLLDQDFILISVPDILNSDIIERCGMSTKGPRSQVITESNVMRRVNCLY